MIAINLFKIQPSKHLSIQLLWLPIIHHGTLAWMDDNFSLEIYIWIQVRHDAESILEQ